MHSPAGPHAFPANFSGTRENKKPGAARRMPLRLPLNGCRSTHARWLCNARSHARETSAKFSGVAVFAGPGRETQRGRHNPDSSYTRCGTHAWAMALCKSHPTCEKVLQSSPLTRVVYVVRMTSKGVKHRGHPSDPLKRAPAVTREKSSLPFCVAPRVPLCAYSALFHSPLSRRRSALSSPLERLALG